MDAKSDIAKTRTNKTTTTIIVGVITLGVGLVIGMASAGTSNGRSGSSGASSTTNQMWSPPNALQSQNIDAWNPFQEIRNMQARMDRLFNQMNEQFQGAASFHGFADIPGYSLSLDVRDLKDRYEVHAYLPDAKAPDVHVSLGDNQILKVVVKGGHDQTPSTTNLVSNVVEFGEYSQEVQLPTPVKADQMKVTRNGHELVITIPKST
jgi:HSP20 family molecular chaperone IbpA